MKIKLRWYIVFLGLSLLAVSCGKTSGSVDARDFDQAAPEIKTLWEAAVAADKANDYYTASVSYGQIMSQESKLTPKQDKELIAASQAMSQRMMDAVDKGDQAAKDAVVKIMAAQKKR